MSWDAPRLQLANECLGPERTADGKWELYLFARIISRHRWKSRGRWRSRTYAVHALLVLRLPSRPSLWRNVAKLTALAYVTCVSEKRLTEASSLMPMRVREALWDRLANDGFEQRGEDMKCGLLHL